MDVVTTAKFLSESQGQVAQGVTLKVDDNIGRKWIELGVAEELTLEVATPKRRKRQPKQEESSE